MVILADGVSRSRLLRKELPYRILLPDADGLTNRRVPVLYLLHGLFGDYTNWTELTRLADYANDHRLAIVMPEARDSWYVDSAVVEQNKFESYLIAELIPEIEALYRVQKTRHGRAVVGLSMGGYGALKYAAKYPALFAFAGSISGALNAPWQSDERPGFDWEALKPSILRAFGKARSGVRRANDLFELFPAIAATGALPSIYLDCGHRDGFLPVNERLHRLLLENNVPHEYFVGEGGHDWTYWDQRIKEVLPKVSLALA
jgi:putative tributyrin esterase